MLTNRIKAKYNIEEIDKDFDIFEVSSDSERDIDKNILDINTDDKRYIARSVVYTWGKTCFMMFDKGYMTDVILRSIFEESGADRYLVNKVNLFDEIYCQRMFFYNKRILLQLLLNSLATSSDREVTYNNLTGKLYYFNHALNKRSKKSLILLEISLGNGMTLFPKAVTFRKMPISCRDRNNTPYIIDRNTSGLRKMLKSEQCKEAYFQKGFEGTHASVSYLGFYYQDFESSKAKAMYDLCVDIKEYLGKYVEIEFSDLETESPQVLSTTVLSDFCIDEVVKRLVLKGIRIINYTGDYGKETQKQWIDICHLLGIPCRTVSKIDDNKYNIVIVRTPEYYKENNLNDPHNQDYGCAVVQHVITDNFQKRIVKKEREIESRYKVVLTELLIKEDVMQNRISLVNWRNYGFENPITFVTRTPCCSDEIKWNVFNVMTISPDGSFRYNTINESGIGVKDSSATTDAFITDCFKTKNGRNDFHVDMAIYENEDDAYIIKHSEERTIPDVEYIGRQMKETDPKRRINTELILQHLSAFEQECGCSDYCSFLRKVLYNSGEYISRKDLHVKDYKSEKKRFYDYFELKTGEVIRPKIKRKHEDPAQLDNLVGIKYFRTPCYSGGNDSCSYSYAVGAKDYSSFKLSMPKAYLVRQIIRKNGTEPDKAFIEKLLNLMQVGFVKYNGNTVLPFPNKYLNEITRLLKSRDPITFGVDI